jgi:predicted RNA-binding Zn-ribbon protein involved in translation (DUF1610 family)
LPERAADGEETAADRPPEPELRYGRQPCPQCGFPICDIAGSKAAICPNCGFKDSCC